jgi:hypothetical protein
LSAVRRSRDAGSSLALALVFLMVFGLYVGTVLQFATTGQRTAVSVREEATNTYATGAALDGAINTIRGDLTAGVDPGGATPPPSTCFTLPAGEVDNASDVTVKCQPRAGSGANTALASAPEHAVLALTTDPAEGVYVPPWFNNVPVRGPVASNESLEVGFLSALTSTNSISARSCTIGPLTLVTPTPDCNGPAAADPAWGGAPTTYPPVVQALPGCATPLITLSPGTYLSQVALQAVLDCPNTVVWFRPGVYYFDFRDSGTHELAVTNAVVVGGTPSGWTPGNTSAAAVPVPNAANPTRSACDPSAPGVDFVFGGDSGISVARTNARLQLCAAETGASQQHVVLRGLANQLGPFAVQPTAGTAAAALNNGTGAQWSNPTSDGAAVGGGTTSVGVSRGNTSRALRVGPFATTTTPLVPSDATGISVTVEVRGRISAGPGTQRVQLTDGSTTMPPTTLRTCPMPAGCTDTALRTNSVTIPIADSQTDDDFVNALSVDVLVSSANVSSPNGGTTTAFVDGVTVSVSFTAPLRATASGATLLRTSGSANNMTVALHGTVYAPKAAVDLAYTSVPYAVIDRGLAVRHARLALAAANGYAGPLISVPDPIQGPRKVLLTAEDALGRRLGRAYVTLSDGNGRNGTTPQVTEWSVG